MTKEIKFIIVAILIFFAMLFISSQASAAPSVSKKQATEIQTILASHGYVLKVDGIYGRKTEKAVRHWQRSNRLVVDGIPGRQTMESLRDSIDGPADTGNPAVRVKPPDPGGLNGFPFASGLSGCDEMSFYRAQWDLPEQFEQLGVRESNCRNDVTSSIGCCVGYWQNYISSHLSNQSAYRERIIEECQVTGRNDILGNAPLQKQKQACVTHVVYSISGLSPWAL